VERWRGALRLLGDEAAEVAWRYGAFELDPTIPAEGVDAGAYLAAKYDAATVKSISAHLTAVAAAEGLPLADMEEPRLRPNTFDAQRLLSAAVSEGPVVQQALGDELFRAYWARGRDIGDREVLADAAAAAGFAREHAAELLASGAFAETVREEERRAHATGIRAVPTFVFDGRFAVSGAQPPEALAHAVREALTFAGT
jgi:predicted DsbA family dithiol-disulfide isomerase